jgi:hypothetical protein
MILWYYCKSVHWFIGSRVSTWISSTMQFCLGLLSYVMRRHVTRHFTSDVSRHCSGFVSMSVLCHQCSRGLCQYYATSAPDAYVSIMPPVLRSPMSVLCHQCSRVLCQYYATSAPELYVSIMPPVLRSPMSVLEQASEAWEPLKAAIVISRWFVLSRINAHITFSESRPSGLKCGIRRHTERHTEKLRHHSNLKAKFSPS